MKTIKAHVFLFKKQLFIIILLSICQIFSNLYTPTILATLVSEGVLKNNQSVIFSEGSLMLIASIIDLILSIIIGLFISKFAIGLSRALRHTLFAKIQNFSPQDFTNFGTSSYIKRTTSDIQTISNTLGFASRMALMAPLMFFGSIVLSLRINQQLSLIMLLFAPIVAIAMFLLIRAISKGFSQLRQISDKMTRILHEGLTGVRVIRAFNKDAYELDRYNKENEHFKTIGFNLNIKFSFMMPLMQTLIYTANIAIIWVGADLIEKHQLNAGELMAMLQYSSLILVALMMLSFVFMMIPQAIVSAKRVEAVLSQEHSQTFNETATGLTDVHHITFNHVTYQFEGAEKPMLSDISFTAKKGEKIAIIGSTGAGKSTILNLLLRFIDATNGEIRYNDFPIAQYSEKELREQIALVPQNRNLFTGTIRSNLQFGKDNATDEEMITALKTAQAWEFVSKLDGGLDAKVEQHGDNFSGGQKQRLAIARAIIKKASVIIFDDSFSALDARTEAALRHELKSVNENAIVFVVAQRISSITDADKILVLNEGFLVGLGTHEELLKSNVIYQEILASQATLSEQEESHA